MSPKLPCLFCFSNSNQKEGHRYQGNKGRRDRVYRFLRDLLGIRLPPEEDFDHLGGDSHLPLCVTCSLIFRNLSGLYDQLNLVQDKITSVVQEIQKKIQNSEGDLTSALAVAINSIGDADSFVKPASSMTSSTLAWMQKFRQKVGQKGETPFSTQNVLFVMGIQQLLENQGQGIAHMVNEGYTVPDGTTTFYLAQATGSTTAPSHQEEVEVDYNVDDDDDLEEGDSDDDYPSDPQPVLMDASDSKEASESEDQDWSRESSPVLVSRKTRSQKTNLQSSGSKTKTDRLTLSKVRRKLVNINTSTTRKKSPTKTSPVKKRKGSTNTSLSKVLTTRKYKCHLCTWSFEKINNLKSHIRTHEGGEVQAFNCEICNQNFRTRKSIKKHNSEYHGDDMPYKCTICSVKRSTSDALKSHMKTHHKNFSGLSGPPWICTICKDVKQFAHKENLKRHLKSHEKVTSFQCPLCPSKCSRKEDMMKHMTKKHKDMESKEGTIFDCNLCPNQFKTPTELITHLWSHRNTKRITCPACKNIEFSTLNELAEHDEQVHGVEVEKINCSICGLTLLTDYLLKQHMKIHQPEKVKELKLCSVCDKTFSDNNTLSRHVKRVHEDEIKAFPCDLCDSSFTRKSELSKHFKNVHDPTTVATRRREKCTKCDKDFFDKKSMERHFKVLHELGNERPFECTQCSKTYKRNDDLRKHERLQHQVVHEKRLKVTPEPVSKKLNSVKKIEGRSYECNICDKTYKKNDDLKTHEKIAHGLIHPTIRKSAPATKKNYSTSRVNHVKVILTTLSPEGTEPGNVDKSTITTTILAEMDDGHFHDDDGFDVSSESNYDSDNSVSD